MLGGIMCLHCQVFPTSHRIRNPHPSELKILLGENYISRYKGVFFYKKTFFFIPNLISSWTWLAYLDHLSKSTHQLHVPYTMGGWYFQYKGLTAEYGKQQRTNIKHTHDLSSVCVSVPVNIQTV